MNVLIDFTQIPKKKVGVGVYALNLIRQLASQDRRNHYVLLVQNDDDCLDDLEGMNIHLIRLNHRLFRRFIFRIAIEQIFIPILIRLKQINIVHSLHYSFPFFRFQAKIVVTIHDMTFFLYPNYHLLIKQVYFRFFIRQVARRADAIIAVSGSTKRDFLRLTGASPRKVIVIPLGRPPAVERSLAMKINPDMAFARFRIKTPYLLYVGTLEPRKNIQRLICVFKRLLDQWPQGHLVIVGAKGWHYKSIFETVYREKLKHKVAFLGFISDLEKYCLMAHADAFVYPSLYEGFGLPVLEAMALGTPTITSNRSAMLEVAGQGALLINPEDEAQLLAGLLSLLMDGKINKDLRRSAKIQSARFRWCNTALSTLNLYKNVHNQAIRQ